MTDKKAIVYWMPESPPCRTIYVVAKLINADLEWKTIDLSKNEQISPEFKKINPFHQIPTLVEPDGFTMYESRSLAIYLIQTRQPDSYLYPAGDLKKRALIDRCLHIDLGTLFRAISDVIFGIFKYGKPNLEKLPRLYEMLDKLEEYFNQNNYEYLAGGSQLSLADIVSYFTLIICEVLEEIQLMNSQRFKNISAWFKRVDDFIKTLDEDHKLEIAQKQLLSYAQYCISQHNKSSDV